MQQPPRAPRNPFLGEYRLQWSLIASVWVHAAVLVVAPVWPVGKPIPGETIRDVVVLSVYAAPDEVFAAVEVTDAPAVLDPDKGAPPHADLPDALAQPETLSASSDPVEQPDPLSEITAISDDDAPQSPPDTAVVHTDDDLDATSDDDALADIEVLDDLDLPPDDDEPDPEDPDHQELREEQFVRVPASAAVVVAPHDTRIIAAHDTRAQDPTQRPVTTPEEGPVAEPADAATATATTAGTQVAAAPTPLPGRPGEADDDTPLVDPVADLQASLGWAPSRATLHGRDGYSEAPEGTAAALVPTLYGASGAAPSTSGASRTRSALGGDAGHEGAPSPAVLVAAPGASSSGAASTHRTPMSASNTSPQTVVPDVQAIHHESRVDAVMTPRGRYTDAVYAILHDNWHAVDLDVDERARGVQGSTTVQFRIASTGRVSDVEILTPSGHAGIDRLALIAIPPRLPRFGPDLHDASLIQRVTFNYGNPLVASVVPR